MGIPLRNIYMCLQKLPSKADLIDGLKRAFQLVTRQLLYIQKPEKPESARIELNP